MKINFDVYRVLFRNNRDTWTPYAVCSSREAAEQIFGYLITHSTAREIRLEHIRGTEAIATTAKTTYWEESEDDD